MLFQCAFKYSKMNLLLGLLCGLFLSCEAQKTSDTIVVGADQLNAYTSYLEGKNIAVVANQTSLVEETHLVDTLLSKSLNVTRVFAPEHGFRGSSDAGAKVQHSKDVKTGLPIWSLYGKTKKPTKELLEGVDIVLFDIQDVGARFYTYISTLHYVMEACAEYEIPLLVLDRPNPNAHYVDGPVLDTNYRSFVGMHPIPIVHGMTIAEYAQMINGEYWLKDSLQCELIIQNMQNYRHDLFYELPVKPSPNLPNAKSVSLYPSLCLFEGTDVSIGRGTLQQFQVVGSPKLDSCSYSFIPVSREGAKYPKHKNILCCGWDLTATNFNGIELDHLIETYHQYNAKGAEFFNSFFDKLAGSNQLRIQIEGGWTSSQIRDSWQADLEAFKIKRKPYMIYP